MNNTPLCPGTREALRHIMYIMFGTEQPLSHIPDNAGDVREMLEPLARWADSLSWILHVTAPRDRPDTLLLHFQSQHSSDDMAYIRLFLAESIILSTPGFFIDERNKEAGRFNAEAFADMFRLPCYRKVILALKCVVDNRLSGRNVDVMAAAEKTLNSASDFYMGFTPAMQKRIYHALLMAAAISGTLGNFRSLWDYVQNMRGGLPFNGKEVMYAAKQCGVKELTFRKLPDDRLVTLSFAVINDQGGYIMGISEQKCHMDLGFAKLGENGETFNAERFASLVAGRDDRDAYLNRMRQALSGAATFLPDSATRKRALRLVANAQASAAA